MISCGGHHCDSSSSVGTPSCRKSRSSGTVVPGTIQYNDATGVTTFDVLDPKDKTTTMTVVYPHTAPDTLKDNAQAVAEGQPCCFTNPQYTGKCVVQPGAGETCASILECLNNPQAQGKSYCGNTTVRGGWALADCNEKKSGPVPGATDRR